MGRYRVFVFALLSCYESLDHKEFSSLPYSLVMDLLILHYGVIFVLLFCYGSLDSTFVVDAMIEFHHLINLCAIASHLT
jgi:hypothetical protein